MHVVWQREENIGYNLHPQLERSNKNIQLLHCIAVREKKIIGKEKKNFKKDMKRNRGGKVKWIHFLSAKQTLRKPSSLYNQNTAWANIAALPVAWILKPSGMKKQTLTSPKQSTDQERSLHTGCSQDMRYKLINTSRFLMFWACCCKSTHLGSSFQLVDAAFSRWKYLSSPQLCYHSFLHRDIYSNVAVCFRLQRLHEPLHHE